MEEIKNKVAESGLITIDLEKVIPQNEIVGFDLKGFLFMEMLLKEKDFRESLDAHDWLQYQDKHVAVFCSSDAIIPMWAYMLAATNLQPIAKNIVFGDEKRLIESVILKELSKINSEDFQDKRVVVKGCGDVSIPEVAYVEIANILRPVAKSIMYGEPCSTVPIFKKK